MQISVNQLIYDIKLNLGLINNVEEEESEEIVVYVYDEKGNKYPIQDVYFQDEDGNFFQVTEDLLDDIINGNYDLDEEDNEY